MTAPTGDRTRTTRLADRLAAARRRHFVGRSTELDLLRQALLAPEPPFAVLHIYGPGGVGKTSLLREYVRLAQETDIPVIALDGRAIEASPPGFLLALQQALNCGAAQSPLDEMAALPRNLLLIDTYEQLAPLDAWLRETFLPQLPGGSLVVIAGRHVPAPAWRTDLDWHDLVRTVPLRNLRPEESQAYLTARGVPTERCPAVLQFTHGHPLALALVADVMSRGHELATLALPSEPDVIRVLLERLVQDIPSAQHRQALEVCVLIWATTETLLTEVLGEADAHALFEWLRGLSFIEHGPDGLFPHDLAREVLAADLRWRDPGGHRRLILQLSTHLYSTFQQARSAEQQRIWFDILYLHRQNPYFKPYFEWSALGSAYAEPASPRDHPAILAMVRRHQGDEAAHIAQHWLDRQPQAFLVYRDTTGEVFGFMAHLTLHNASPEDIAIDPAVPAALAFAQRHGPVRPGEEILHLRFWMHRDAYQGVSPALNLTAVNCSIAWTTHPRLAWNFITTADPAFLEPHFTSIHMWRVPEADFEVAGRRYGIFAHDWRVEPPAAWMTIKHELASLTAASPAQPPVPPSPPPSLVVLPQVEFAAAVRQALRDYTRPDRLTANPLLRSGLIGRSARQEATCAALQALLREAAVSLKASPKDTRLYRAVWHTYIEPAATQELAAERLGLPFSTYRRHLTAGIERITEWLWQRELQGAAGEP